MHISPSNWGPSVWKSIHIICLAYPINPTQKERDDYKMYFETLGKVIPCTMCRSEYNELLSAFPVNNYLINNETLFNWSVNIHNMVNSKLKKKQINAKKALSDLLQFPKSTCELDPCSQINQSYLLVIAFTSGILCSFLFKKIVRFTKLLWHR